MPNKAPRRNGKCGVVRRRRFNDVADVSALVRFLYHTYQGPVAFATILPLGVIFAAAYWKWRNLWPLVLAPTAMNILGWAMT